MIPETGQKERRELFLPFFVLSLAVVVLVLPVPVKEQISRALRASVLAPFIRTQEALISARVRGEQASEMQVRLDSAIVQLLAQTTLREENERLRALLDLNQRPGAQLLPASAIRAGTLGSESMFLLDVGSQHGVAVNDPVVVADGLIGVIREVFVESAVVMDWTHPEFGVSVMTVDGQAFGFVESRQGAFREEDRLILNGVPYYTVIETGALLVTSGRGSVYPRGIPVGRVGVLAEAEEGWRKSFWVDPLARPGSATHVLVLTATGPGTTQSLAPLWLPDEPPPAEGSAGERPPVVAPTREVPPAVDSTNEAPLPVDSTSIDSTRVDSAGVDSPSVDSPGVDSTGVDSTSADSLPSPGTGASP